MTNIPRYTRTGLFNRLEKHDGGELVYYHNHDDEIREKDELIDKLSKNNEMLYEQWSEMSLENGKYLSQITTIKDNYDSLKLLTKKYSIIGFVSMVVNIGLITWLLMN